MLIVIGVLIIVLASLIFLLPKKELIRIDNFNLGGEGKGPPTVNYTLFDEKLKGCVIYTSDGSIEKLQIPNSCPVIIDSSAPNGRTKDCKSQANPVIFGENTMQLWQGYVSLEEVKSFKICCSTNIINSNSANSVIQSDLECSNRYVISN